MNEYLCAYIAVFSVLAMIAIGAFLLCFLGWFFDDQHQWQISARTAFLATFWITFWPLAAVWLIVSLVWTENRWAKRRRRREMYGRHA